jgi:hypothetical protein
LQIGKAAETRNLQQIGRELGAALPQLKHLTHLSVEQTGLNGAGLQGLSKLLQLREFILRDKMIADSAFMHLPARLTMLHINSAHWVWPRGLSVVLNSRNTVRLRQLSSLQRLELWGLEMQDAAGLLAELTQLTSLDLSSRW